MNLNLLQWNLKGYHSQRPYLQHAIDILKPTVIALQETHLKPNQNAHLTRYQPPLRKDRTANKGGGVALFIHTDIPFTPLPLTTSILGFSQLKFCCLW